MNNSIAISREKLLTLRNLLPHGSNRRIAKRVGCTQQTVSRTLNGKSEYPGVIKEALRIIKMKKSLVADVNETLK